MSEASIFASFFFSVLRAPPFCDKKELPMTLPSTQATRFASAFLAFFFWQHPLSLSVSIIPEMNLVVADFFLFCFRLPFSFARLDFFCTVHRKAFVLIIQF